MAEKFLGVESANSGTCNCIYNEVTLKSRFEFLDGERSEISFNLFN